MLAFSLKTPETTCTTPLNELINVPDAIFKDPAITETAELAA